MRVSDKLDFAFGASVSEMEKVCSQMQAIATIYKFSDILHVPLWNALVPKQSMLQNHDYRANLVRAVLRQRSGTLG